MNTMTTMKISTGTNLCRLAAAVLLAATLGGPLGCGRDSAIEVRRDNQGNQQIQVDRNKIDQNLHQAGQELRQGASALGQAAEKGARDLDRSVGPVVRETVEDAALTARVKARLIATPDLGGIRIHVSSRAGQVTLDGVVRSDDLRLEAEKIARRTEGVHEVIDHLQVGPAS